MEENGEIPKESKEIFFIESHLKKLDKNKLLIYLSERDTGVENLESKKEEEITETSEKKRVFIINLYSCLIIPEKFGNLEEKKIININMEYDKVIYQGFIKLSKLNPKIFRYIFVYDFNFGKGKYYAKEHDAPQYFQMNNLDKFKFFLAYLKGKNLLQNSPLMQDLILSSQDLIREYQLSDKTVHIDFLLSIYKECFAVSEIASSLFLSIKIDNLCPPFYDMKKCLKEFKFLHTIYSKPNVFLTKLEKSKEKYCLQFYGVYLYYLITIDDSNKIQELIKNKNIEIYVFNSLKRYNTLYDKISLEIETLKALISSCENYEFIANVFCYIKDFNIYLILLNEYFNKIEQYIIEINNAFAKKFSLSNIQKRYEDIELIEKNFEEIINKLKKIKEKNYFIFIEFKKEIWEEYFIISSKYPDTLKYFVILKKYFNLSKELYTYKENSSLTDNINKKIHEIIMKKAVNNLLNNQEIIDSITTIDEFFINKKYECFSKDNFLILGGLSLIDQEENFYEKLKNIKFYKYFQNYKKFLIIIANKINHLKYFNIFFQIFDLEDPYCLTIDFINILFNKIKNIFPTFSNEISEQVFKDLLLLYNLMEIKKQPELQSELLEIIELNNDISEYFKLKFYLTIFNKYDHQLKQNDDLRLLVLNLISKDKIDFLQAFNYLEEKNIRWEFISVITHYTIEENEFFNLAENKKFIFLKELLKEKDLSFLDNTNYYKSTIKTIESIYKNLIEKKIKISLLKKLFCKPKLKDEVLSRLSIICRFKNKDPEILYEEINKDINFINENHTFASEVKFFLEPFFKLTYEKEIKYLKNIKEKIIKGELGETLDLINNFKDMEKLKNAIQETKKYFCELFKIIFYQLKKENSGEKEDNLFKNSTKKLMECKIILMQPEKIDKKLINNWLNSLNNKEENILKEINLLKNIYKLNNIEREDILVKKLKCFSKIDILIQNLESIKYYLDLYSCVKSDFYSDIENALNTSKNYEFDKIFDLIQKFKKYNVIIYSFENNKEKAYDSFIDLLICLNNKSQAIKFLEGKTYDELRNLHEILDQKDESTLTNDDIEDFIKCVNFRNNLGKLSGCKDIDIINKLKDNYEKEKKNNIILYFKNYIEKYVSIIVLYENFDITESIRQKIKKICEKSKFILKTDSDFRKIVYLEKNDNEDINFEKLEEMRSQSLLSKNTEKSKNYKIFETFNQFVSQITYMVKYLKDLVKKGYPKKIEIQVEITNCVIKYIPKTFKLILKNGIKDYKDHENIISYLKRTYENLSNRIIEEYKKNEYIRYIYGRQFKTLAKYLKGSEENIDFSPFLRYFTNNLYEKDSEIGYFEENKKSVDSIIKDMLNNCTKYLKDIIDINNLSFEKIYEDSLIKLGQNKDKYHGLYSLYVEGNKSEKEILNIYLSLTSKLPIAQCILMCNEETSEEEFTSFLYRAVKCRYNALFLVSNIESLSVKQCNIIIHLLNELIFEEKNFQMKACLLIIYANKKLDIIKQITKKKCHKTFIKPNKEQMIPNDDKLKNLLSNNEIIYSDMTGVGKSRYINNNVSINNYIYFPFGGVLTRKNIYQRLLDLYNKLKKINPNQIKNYILHLDLYETQKDFLMKDFLFSILITKFYRNNENIVYIAKELKIKIEIPNGYISFFRKYPILQCIKSHYLEIVKLPKLIASKNICSNIQITCNYLKLYEQNSIEKEDLYIKGVSEISEEYFKEKATKHNMIKAKILSDEECERLIKKYLKIKQPNYYQIQIFIDTLGGQLRKLTNNYYLTVETLSELKISGLRQFLINSFIKNTEHFSEGAFESIVKKDIINENENKSLYISNEEEEKEKIIEELSHEKTISYQQIKPSLVFFHESGAQTMSVITSCLKQSAEYGRFMMLYKSQGSNIKELPDPKKFNQIEFLKEMEKILNLKPQVTIEKEKKKNELIEENKEKVKDNQLIIKNDKREDDSDNDSIHSDYEKEKDDLDNDRDNKDDEDLNIIQVNNKKINNKSINFIKNEIKKKEIIIKEIKNNGKIGEEKNENLEYLEKIRGKYVFTSDNFIKMIFILLRIREGVPIIMMGETGCGKTALIKKLSQFINFGEEKMLILNIHAGTDNKDIIDFIENKVLPKAKELADSEKMKKKENIIGEIHQEKKLWVFFDEINTCNSMGLLSEIICKHSYNGIKIDENIVFIAACNPYRKGKEQINGLIYPGSKHKTLVYTVNPLPFSLLNFVFNFGSLTKEDEEKYIKSIIEETMNKYLIDDELKNMAQKALVFSHDFIKRKSDVSSVSLREIRRFNIFFDYFVIYYEKKEEFISENNKNKDNSSKKLELPEKYKNCIMLSIFICYYLRISNPYYQNSFEREIRLIFKKVDFRKIFDSEANFILNEIKLDEGIAKNNALKRNIFAMFSCINAKVPLFIVGKPGSSKSLSVQLIFKAMKGNLSESNFFKKFPSIIMNSFQGSENTNSRGVEKIFDKAEKVLNNFHQKGKEKNIISLIFFDEMGLAEISDNNPLKVLHSRLDYDLLENEKKIAFIGISNWSLDASKMNRGIFLSIPEPNEEDYIETALTIMTSFDSKMDSQYKEFITIIAIVFKRYKEKLKNRLDKKYDFHGNRDFYNLIKIIAKELISRIKADNIINANDNYELSSIAINSIERNLAGLTLDESGKNSVEEVKKIYNEETNAGIGISSKYDVIKRIGENLQDESSRYLLIISDNYSMGIFLVKVIIKELKKEEKKTTYITGSRFKEDQTDEYTLKILKNIQVEMEEGNLLILSDLDKAYPALYELFNQNFSVIDNKKHTRISLGYSNNQYCRVHDKFKCIVIVNQENVDKQRPPFLNRFEKHQISFESLLGDRGKKISNEIYGAIKELFNYNNYYRLDNIILNCNKEEIQGLTYMKVKQNDYDEKVKSMIIQKFSVTFPQDIYAIMQFSGFCSKFKEISNIMIKSYEENNSNYQQCNLIRFIENTKFCKNIIYTFSSILEKISFSKKKSIKNKHFENLGSIEQKNIFENLIFDINSESELELSLYNFYNDEEKKVFILSFSYEEIYLLNPVNAFIDNYIKKNRIQNKKIIIYTVHIKRIFIDDLTYTSTLSSNNNSFESIDNNDDIMSKKSNIKITSTISHLEEGINQVFIDNINGREILITQLMKKKIRDILNDINLKDVVQKESYHFLIQYEHKVISRDKNLKNFEYIKHLIGFIKENDDIKKDIITCIENHIKEEKDIIKSLLDEKFLENDDSDMVSVLHRYVEHLFGKLVKKFIYISEKNHFLPVLLKIYKEKEIKEINDDVKNEIINNDEEEEEEEIINIKDNDKSESDIIKLFIDEIKKDYCEQIDLYENLSINIKNPPEIKIYLDFKILGFYNDLFKLSNSILEQIKNDKNFLKIIKILQSDIEVQKASYVKIQYDKYEENHLLITYNEIINKFFLRKLFDLNGNKYFEKIMQFLLEDYILNYIIKYNICDAEDEQIEKIITLIKLVLNMRYEKGVSIYDKNKNDYIKLFIIKINWLERNLLYMKNIILIYLKINKIIAAIHLKSNENNDYLINKTLDRFVENII